jgi:hypothetical protein
LVWLPTVTSSDSILPIDRDGNEMAHIVRTIVWKHLIEDVMKKLGTPLTGR